VLIHADATAPDRQQPAEPVDEHLPPARGERRRRAAEEPGARLDWEGRGQRGTGPSSPDGPRRRAGIPRPAGAPVPTSRSGSGTPRRGGTGRGDGRAGRGSTPGSPAPDQARRALDSPAPCIRERLRAAIRPGGGRRRRCAGPRDRSCQAGGEGAAGGVAGVWWASGPRVLVLRLGVVGVLVLGLVLVVLGPDASSSSSTPGSAERSGRRSTARTSGRPGPCRYRRPITPNRMNRSSRSGPSGSRRTSSCPFAAPRAQTESKPYR